jgi:hypothetical protein
VPSSRPLLAIRGVTIAALVAAGSPARAQVTPPVTPATGFATIRGTAIDSIRHQALVRALVAVEGTTRIAVTDAFGNFEIDSVPPGSHRLSLMHPVLDTLGMAVMTNPMVMRPGEVLTVDIATPSGERVVAMRCSPGQLQRFGPAAIMGQVMDPDSMKAAVGSRVQLVYEEITLGFKGKPIVREATVDSVGNYRICGLPTPVAGKLQVFRGGVSTGQVDIDVDGPLGLRSLTIAAARVATVADSVGRTTRFLSGDSRLRGRVMAQSGAPVQSARVSVEGARSVAVTNERGEFNLDSLPSGTQSVEVRKIGYAATVKAVELSAREPATTTIVLDAAELAPMRIVAGVEKALNDAGYTDRKRRGLGHFIDGDEIANRAVHLTDALRMVPGLHIAPAGNGRSVIQNSRDPLGGCVNIFVDQVRWREMSPGDVDDFVSPSEVAAIETYTPSNVPVMFQAPGESSCATVVIWTHRYVNRRIKR